MGFVPGVGAGGRLVNIGPGSWRIEGQGNAIKIEADGIGDKVTDAAGQSYRFGITVAQLCATRGRLKLNSENEPRRSHDAMPVL